jgi:hypothetical protein
LSARRKTRWSAKVKSAEAPGQERDRNASALRQSPSVVGFARADFRRDRSREQTPDPSTAAVVNMARNPTAGGKNRRFKERMALVPERTDVEAQQHVIYDRDAEDRNECDGCQDTEWPGGDDHGENAAEERDRICAMMMNASIVRVTP